MFKSSRSYMSFVGSVKNHWNLPLILLLSLLYLVNFVLCILRLLDTQKFLVTVPSGWIEKCIIRIKSFCSEVIYEKWKVKALVTQSCLTLWDPMDCSPPGSAVHGVLEARILEGLAISFSRGSSWPRDWTWVSCITGRFFTLWASREPKVIYTSF